MRSKRSRSPATHRVVALLMSFCVGVAFVPRAALALPPPKPAPVKKPVVKPTGRPDDEFKRAEARRRYADAETRFQGGDYEGAYASYKGANDLLMAPQTLFKMAICLDRLDKTNDAITAYQTFLGSSPPASMDAKVNEAQVRVADLKKKLPAVIKVRSDPPSASVILDGAAQPGTTPLEFKASSGHHRVRVTSPGYDPYERELELEGGSETTVDAALPRSSPDAPPAPQPVAETHLVEKAQLSEPEQRSNAPAYVVLGLAGAGAVVGGIFGVKALQEKSDFDSSPQKTADQADSVERDALIADMALGAALTLGVTGVVLLISNASSSNEKSERPAYRARLQLLPVIAPGHAGAAASVRF
jgi:hypothetical protein